MIATWRFPVQILLALCAILCFPEVTLSAPRVSQPEYVRVTEWAKTQGLSPSWIKRDDLLLLTRGSTRILLKMASRQADVNGVRVWQFYPVIQRDGYVRISKKDAEDTFGPLIIPKRGRTAIRTVCLDPGHGGRDPGFKAGSRYEKTYTLLLAREVRDLLAKQKIKVVLTRSTDYYLDLEARPALAKRRGADMFVSLHFNSAGKYPQRTAKGAEVYALPPAGAPSTTSGDRGSGAEIGNRNDDQNMYLAYQIQKSLASVPGVEDRGVQRARFVVLKEASMPAVLVESGFMSHPTEAQTIYDTARRKRLAKAIADGIMAYKRVSDPKTK